MKRALVLMLASCGSAAPARPIEAPVPATPAPPPPRYAAPALAADPSFGTNGRLRFDDVYVRGGAMLPDDSFVLLTTPNYRDEKPAPDTRLVRYTPEGVVDRSWGTNGWIHLPDSWDASVKVDAKGRIVINAAVTKDDVTERVILRLLPTGAADPTFGTDGRVTFDPSPGHRDNRTSVFMQPDGSFVIAIVHWEYPTFSMETRRMSETGVLSPQVTPIVLGGDLRAAELATRRDGSLVLAGYNPPPKKNGAYAFVGALKPDFSIDYIGALIRTPPITHTDTLWVDAKDRIYLGAMKDGPSGRGPMAVLRFTPDGRLDETWADKGAWGDDTNADLMEFMPVADGTVWAVTVDQDHEYQVSVPHTILVHFDETGHVTAKAPGIGETWSAGNALIDHHGRVLLFGGYADYELHEDDQTPPMTSIIERFAPP